MAITNVISAETSQFGQLKAYLITFTATSGSHYISTGAITAATGAAIAQSLPSTNGQLVCEPPSFREVKAMFAFHSAANGASAGAIKYGIVNVSATDNTLAALWVSTNTTRLITVLVLGY